MDWISVKDRLPEETGRYMIKGVVSGMYPKTFEDIAMYLAKAKYFNYGFDGTTITHWMPLLKPLKKTEDE